jgi:TolB-like protein
MGAPPALDIDLLRTFVLIAEGQSFTRAAERVGRTQSAVSLQVSRLESLVGRRLFSRARGRGARLTPQGERLLEDARRLTALNDSIVETLRSDTPEGGATTGSHAPASEALAQMRPARSRPSIAILPFHNLGGDPADEYFVEGVVDDIAAGLSRIDWLLVIARSSCVVYKGRNVDLRRIGRELGARYALQGGVRRAGRRLQINAQLIDAASGALIWADRYDRRADDVFELQDEIADQVAAMVEPRLRRSEIARAQRKRAGRLDAYDLFLRAIPHTAAHMPQGTELALPLLERALELEPDYASAHALAAWCHEWRFTRGGFDPTNRSASLSHAEAAIAGAGDDANALAIAGFVTGLIGDERDAGLEAMRQATSLNGASATVFYLASHAHAIVGDAQRATTFADRAFRLSPFDPLAFEANVALGDLAMSEARHEDAAACFARAVRINPNYSTGHYFRAIALALAGRQDRAELAAREGHKREPEFSTRIMYEVGLAPAIIERFLDGARLLGLPG